MPATAGLRDSGGPSAIPCRHADGGSGRLTAGHDGASLRSRGGHPMVRIDLEPEDARELSMALRGYLASLRREIARTERRQYRREMLQTEALLERVVATLDAQLAGIDAG